MIGVTAIPLSSALPPISAASRQSLIARQSFRIGASDFEALQSAMRRDPHSIVLYAFDLLHLDGRDLRQQTLTERRAYLQALVGDDDESRIQFSDEFDGDGATLFKACGGLGLEGIVSKHALAPYRSGR